MKLYTISSVFNKPMAHSINEININLDSFNLKWHFIYNIHSCYTRKHLVKICKTLLQMETTNKKEYNQHLNLSLMCHVYITVLVWNLLWMSKGWQAPIMVSYGTPDEGISITSTCCNMPAVKLNSCHTFMMTI